MSGYFLEWSSGVDRKHEKIVQQRIQGSHNLVINKYSCSNITVLEGRIGSGKTYYMENFLGLDSKKKLLLASKSDCKSEYLSLLNTSRKTYYDSYYEVKMSSGNINESLKCILKKEVIDNYDVIIIDNIFFSKVSEVQELFDLCIQYQNTEFFILSNVVDTNRRFD